MATATIQPTPTQYRFLSQHSYVIPAYEATTSQNSLNES